jgi:hypothetical protein
MRGATLAGEGGWESVRSGESGSSGRQVGDKKNKRALGSPLASDFGGRHEIAATTTSRRFDRVTRISIDSW